MEKMIAILAETAFWGVGIFELKEGIYEMTAKVARVYENEHDELVEVSITLDENMQPHFYFDGTKYLVNDFIKVE